MKKNQFLKRTLPMAVAAVVALSPVAAMAAPSSDLAGHWAEKVVTEWQEKGLIKGYADGTFKPGNNITRAEYITIMNNALGYEDAAPLHFKDVVAGSWYHGTVAKAVAAGYVKGYDDGTFKPNNTITRAEAAVMIASAMGLGERGSEAQDFADAADLPGWAKGSIGAVVEAKYMSGYPDGSFGARKPITRAEAVSALNRVRIGGYSEDMVVTEPGAVVENKVVAGDLIIDKKVDSSKVYLNNVEIKGDLIIDGCENNSVYLKNVKVNGKVRMNKKGIHMHVEGNTDLPKVEINAFAKLSHDEAFTGEIGTVTVAKELDRSKKVEINTEAQKLVINAKAGVLIHANIETVEIGEAARVEVTEAAGVQQMIINAITALTGSGTIESLKINVDDVTVDKALVVKAVEAVDGVNVPSHLRELLK